MEGNHVIVGTSLGLELALSWWGNSVFIDYGKGNWSEGLATCVADHLYMERGIPFDPPPFAQGVIQPS